MPDGTTLTSVAMPFEGRQVATRVRRLIDTTDHSDAVLIGHDGPVPIDELGGLLAILKTDATGEHTLILTGCEGEVEVPGYALAMLVSELRRAGVGQ